MHVKIELDATPILRLLKDIPQDVIPLATSRALNKTAQAVQTVAIKAISADIGVKQSVIRPTLRLDKAHRNRLSARVNVIDVKRFSLMMIDPRAKQTAQGVSYRGQGGRRLIAHAFIATMKSGHRGIFKRLGKARLPIRELEGVSVYTVFLKPPIQAAMQMQACNRWSGNLLHELRYELHRRGYD